MLLVLGIATALNYKFKWITQDDIDQCNEILIPIFFGTLLWPLTLVIGLVAGIVYLFVKYALPE